MKYFYIHGLNSTGAFTSSILSNVLNEKVIRLDWNANDSYGENFIFLKEQIDNKVWGEDFILIGSSLGGFYTNILADSYEVPCVLINPVVNVEKAFEKAKTLEFFKDVNFEKIYESYKDISIQEKLLPRVVIIGENDEILDPNIAINKWKNKCNLIITKDKHQLDNYEPFVEDIKHLSTPLFYDINECV